MESTALQTYCYHYLWLRQGGYAKSVDYARVGARNRLTVGMALR